MSYTVILLMRAQRELLEAWEWYEDKQAGLGDRFKNIVMERIHGIAQHPERYPIRKRIQGSTYRRFPISNYLQNR